MEVVVAVQSGSFVHAQRTMQEEEFPPTEERATTKFLKQPKRRVAHPRAIESSPVELILPKYKETPLYSTVAGKV